MRVRSLMLAAAGAALIAPAAHPGAAPPREAGHERVAHTPETGATGTTPSAPGTWSARTTGNTRKPRNTEKTPDGPDRPGSPHGPDGPGASGAPGAPGAPGVLGAPGVSGAPDGWKARGPWERREPREPWGTRHVRAADLLAAVRDCAPVSRGRFRSDDGRPADIEVCGRRDAVFWKADMDIDCDGRPGRHCNERTDPLFSDSTAYQQSDGRQLSAERLPYVVVPAPSHRWNHREHDVRRGTVAAVVHGDRVGYAVVGDVGPDDIIGEASYALARDLGIRPDPTGGGAASGVTYILFKGSGASPIENRGAAAAQGERLAREFVGRN